MNRTDVTLKLASVKYFAFALLAALLVAVVFVVFYGEGEYLAALSVLSTTIMVVLVASRWELLRLFGIAFLPQVTALLNQHQGPFTIQQIVLYAGLAVCIPLVILRSSHAKLKRTSPLLYGLVIFGASLIVESIIHVVTSDVKVEHSVTSITYNLLPMLYGAICITSLDTGKGVDTLSMLLVLEALLLAVIGIVVYTIEVGLSVGGFAETEVGEYKRLSLGFGSSNILGVFYAMSLAWIAGNLMSGTRLRRSVRIVYLVAAATCAIALLLTFSRRGLIGAAVALAIAFLLKKKKLIAVVTFVAIGVIVVQVSPQRLTERIETIANPEYVSNTTRIDEFMYFKRRILDSPLVGFGPGTIIKPPGEVTRVYFHNYYLVLAYEYGAIGLVAYLFVWMFIIRRQLVSIIKRETEPQPYAMGGLLVAAVVLVAGLMGLTNITFPVGFLTFIYLAMSMAGNKSHETRTTEEARGA